MTEISAPSIVPTEAVGFRGIQTRRRLSPVATSSANALASARPAYKTQVRPEDRQVGRKPSNTETKAVRFREVLEGILDESQWCTRTNGQWSKLHKQFVTPFLSDLDKGESGSIEAKARIMTIHYLSDEENPTDEKLIKVVEDSYQNHAAYNSAGIKLIGYHPKFQLFLWAAVFHENLIYLQLEKTRGPAKSMVSKPEPLDLELLPEEYNRRLRAALVYARLVDRDLYLPQMLPNQLNVNQRSPFDLKPIWASRQLGMEPAIRSFPELASVITDIQDVEYLAPGRNAPPAILLHFSKPLFDVVSGRSYEQLAVALLKTTLPVLACQDEDETPYVSFDEQAIQAFAFGNDCSLITKTNILRQISELAIAKKLLPRVGYSYYSLDGARRYASIAGSTEQERNAVFQTSRAYFDTELARSKDGLGFGQKPNTDAYRKELERKFQHWQEITPVLSAFGVLESKLNPQMHQRIQLLATRKGLSQVARDENLGPSARIFVLQIVGEEKNRFVVHANDAKRLAQRMNNAADILLSAGSQIGKLKDSFRDEKERTLFLCLLNLGVFMNLPANSKKPFVRTLPQEAEEALCGQYPEAEHKAIHDFLSQVHTELKVEMPAIQCRDRETLESGIQDLYDCFRFIRFYQEDNHDEALELSNRFSPELNHILKHLLEPIIQAKREEKRRFAETVVLQILEAEDTARDLFAREALLPRIYNAKKSLGEYPDLVEQIIDIENRLLPPKMIAAREILEDSRFTQDLKDSRNQILRSLLEAVSQGQKYAKEEKVRRHVEAKVKREPHLCDLHSRVLTHLFPKMD